jgi:phosphatidate cytidylyltransferase
MFPVILAGVFNMLFLKIPFLKSRCRPIDGGKNWTDGKRIFGDSKSVLGFILMTVLAGLLEVFWGFLLQSLGQNKRSLLYLYFENRPAFNFLIGMLFGFLYMLFELPNSFIKRRLSVSAAEQGDRRRGIKMFFFILDQIDSMFGIMLCLGILVHLTPAQILYAIFLGGLTHVLVNCLLILFRVRKYL